MQSMKISSEIYGYNEKDDNRSNQCSLFTWTEIIDLLLDRKNPFDMKHPFIYSKTYNKFVEI